MGSNVDASVGWPWRTAVTSLHGGVRTCCLRARRARPRLSHHRRRACPTDQPMAPGADIGGAANRQIADGMSLRSARGAQVKDLPSKGAGTSATSQKTEAPVLTARERLRMHVNRNLALQQTSNSDKGPASAGGPPAAPRGASPANSNTPPPTAHQGIASKRDSVPSPTLDWANAVCLQMTPV